ncbi:hypothetical protein M426DRAFT_13680 [Hypoxylon sp. CI-4A]|nr:hypothetical protein M426DRAFT_13680 [Hypoxylon sp. CI-4A]
MDLLDELESMAQFAIQQPEQPDEPDDTDIKRWQSLFGYTYSQAIQKIEEHRADLSRVLVTDSHWEIVRAEKESEGYDKEAYEHACSLSTRTGMAAPQKSSTKPATKPSTFLLKLEGPFSDAKQVQLAACLAELPEELGGTDDSGNPAAFCKISSESKEKLLEHLSLQGSRFQPTMVRYSKAEKDLSAGSAYPTLGIDTTMPQHRPGTSNDQKLVPAQDQYPVWYFFYGTLGEAPGGKYKALVDGTSNAAGVQGQAFLVQTQEQEHCLQLYETDKYEVVRCEIEIGGQGTVKGLTFRFIGDFDS